MRSSAVISLVLMAVFQARAEVYRWTDDKGVVHYADKAPAPGAKPVDLPKLQTYAPSPPTPEQRATKEELPATQAPADISIVTPQPGETIRDAEGKVPVVVAGSLQAGQGLVYFLDGRAQNTEPTPSTGYLLDGVERGEHQISASLVAADGRELARTAPVTIYLQKTSVSTAPPKPRPGTR